MSAIEIRGVSKKYAGKLAVDNLELEVEQGKFVTLLGPSGCGKTTTLRSIAGLAKVDEGKIVIGGRLLADGGSGYHVPPEKRQLGMVFQGYALWPHMTAAQNIAYPLRLQRRSRSQIRQRVQDLLDTVGLSDAGPRKISELSGGMQQRVALARALAAGSGTVLYDEPLSNLDAQLRALMRNELRSLHDEAGTTSIFVTHDQEEALALSDTVVVMAGGRVVQTGTPKEVYEKPRNAFVAKFLGFENVLSLEPQPSELGGRWRIGSPASKATLVDLPSNFRSANGLAIKAQHVRLGTDVRTGEGPAFDCVVDATTYLGDRVRIVASMPGLSIECISLRHLTEIDALPSKGQMVKLQLPERFLAPLSG